ncbi:MAG: LacI family transcriptional regulator [Chloroflexi bacterium]|nr:MAG: LacI family transcriptional regulator [Chloroflexota bacterium]
MKRKRVTITQVAQAAGVSPATVSFAFNNPEQVGPGTAQRVRQIAQQLGYSPNPIARAMISRRTGVIGMLVPFSIASSFANPFFMTFMQGVGSVCDAHSISVLVVSPYKGSLEEATRRAPVDAYIVLGLSENHEELEPLRRREVPFVVVDGDTQTRSSINIDDEAGAYAAAAYLLRAGHRDILIITFQNLPPENQEDVHYGVGGRRLAGYRRAFTEFGIALPADHLIPSMTNIEGSEEAFRRALAAGMRPTAVLTMSDVHAIGAVREAQRFGMRVPQDLEVIGFDDIPLAGLVSPALSTVHQPIQEKGERAAELLIEALEEIRPPMNLRMETELILRGTTRPVI